MSINTPNTPKKTVPNREGLEKLKALLDQEIMSYTQVEERLVEKNDCIIQGNTAGLEKADQAINALNHRLQELERNRLNLMIEMGQEKQSLKELINCIDDERAKPLNTARENLCTVVDSVQDLNQTSQSLLDLSLKWVDSSVDMITKLLMPETTAYTATGAKSTARQLPEQVNIIRSTVEHEA